jgi:hypothetical protein
MLSTDFTILASPIWLAAKATAAAATVKSVALKTILFFIKITYVYVIKLQTTYRN